MVGWAQEPGSQDRVILCACDEERVNVSDRWLMRNRLWERGRIPRCCKNFLKNEKALFLKI